MAIDNQFGKGIGLAAGFDLGAQKPLDSRVAVNTIAERDAHVTENRAYEGMLVYVAEANMTYQLVKGEEEGQLVWKEFGFNQSDFDDSFEGAIEEVDNRLKAVEEDLAQGGEIEARIAQNESDIDGLQGLVGVPADGENEASGLHLALDNAKEELDQAILDEKGRAEQQEGLIRQELADEAAEIRNEIAQELGNYSVEAGEGVEAKDASGLRKEIEDAHNAMNQAMADEAARVNKKIADDIAAENALRVAEEAAIRQEMANEAARVNQKIADDIAAESALRVAEEQRIEKECDDAMAQEVIDRNAAIEVEKLRAEGKEAELLQAINKEIEDREGAVQDLADRHDEEMEAAANKVAEDLAALKLELQGEIDGDVAAEAKLRDDADKALDERVKPLEAHVAAQPGVDAEQDRRLGVLEADAPVKQAAIEAAQDAADAAQADVDAIEERLDAEGGLVDRIEANEANIARLDGAVDIEGSVKKQIKDAVDTINADAEALEARVKANEDDIVEMKAEEAKIREDFAAADAQVLADAKAHAEQKIADLVDSAPDAMNTLNELAEAINANKGIYDAYVDQHNKDMAALKEELQGEIDDDVEVVANELAKQMDPAQDGTLAKKIADEVTRATTQENDIREKYVAADNALKSELQAGIEAAVSGEASRAKGEETAIRGEFAAADTALHTTISAEIDADVKEEKERAEGEEAKIRQELANEIGNYAVAPDENGENGKEASGLRKEIAEADAAIRQVIQENHEDLEGALDTKVQAINKAMEDESARVDQKIADDIAAESALRVAEEQRIEKALEDEAAAIRGEMADAIGVPSKAADENGEGAVEASGMHQVVEESVAAEKARAEAQEAAIRGEFAAADEVLHATVKSEMAAVIQSLAVGIVDGKLRVALGGIEGDDVLVIREQEIDFVTDDEIDEIIAGLDAPAAE